jgi:hypothetical protein
MRSILLSLPIAMAVMLPRAATAEPAHHIDVSHFPAALVEDVVVPVPAEVFAVLDKLGEPDWRREMRGTAALDSQDRAHIALLLGTVIADGFVAVQAQDVDHVKEVGREVLRLAAAISVRESVVRRSQSIIDAASNKKWPEVRRELDKALQDVRAAMIELNDEQLAQLVSLGGWLRGTEALTSIVSRNYSQDTAELLHQPGLFSYFQGRIEHMPESFQKNPIVGRVRLKLDEMRPLIDVPNGRDISAESVGRVRDITRGLVGVIMGTEKLGDPAPQQPGPTP